MATNKKEAAALNYKDMKIEDIILWCKEHGQVAWLKETAAKKVPVNVYPRKKVMVLDAEGKPALTKKGKIKYTTVADKDKAPKKEMRPISFIQIKTEFVEKFMPEIKPAKKAAAVTMYDLIENL